MCIRDRLIKAMDTGINMLGQFQGDPSFGQGPSWQTTTFATQQPSFLDETSLMREKYHSSMTSPLQNSESSLESAQSLNVAPVQYYPNEYKDWIGKKDEATKWKKMLEFSNDCIEKDNKMWDRSKEETI